MADPAKLRTDLHAFLHVAPGCRGEECPLVKPDGTVDRLATVVEAWVMPLREALDDLWGCIAKAEIEQLQPGTVELAKANHERLWHEKDDRSWRKPSTRRTVVVMTAERSLGQHVYLLWLGDELKAVYADSGRANDARTDLETVERVEYGGLALPVEVQAVEVK